MGQWSPDYICAIGLDVLEWSFTAQRRVSFAPAQERGFDWDRTRGMFVRAWLWAREHPTWLRDVVYDTSNEGIANLFALAAEQTTVTRRRDVPPSSTPEDTTRIHIERQIAERLLIGQFVEWALGVRSEKSFIDQIKHV